MTQKFPAHKSLMSRPRILHHLEKGNIVIDPFKEENLGTTQYDVTTGAYFYRFVDADTVDTDKRLAGSPIYNPFSEAAVTGSWRLNIAKPHQDVMTALGWDEPLDNIPLDARIILLRPGETILGHTEEFIGGASRGITTMMKARSSAGRNLIQTCHDAGMGDVGYHTRWTLEITNNNRDHSVPLVVGRRIAQLIFFEVDEITDADYTSGGKYQTSSNLKTIKETWAPEDMLPKQWLDREVTE